MRVIHELRAISVLPVRMYHIPIGSLTHKRSIRYTLSFWLSSSQNISTTQLRYNNYISSQIGINFIFYIFQDISSSIMKILIFSMILIV